MPGAEHLRDCTALIDLLRAQKEANRLYSAICAAPVVVLHHHGLIQEEDFTCYPAFAAKVAGMQCLRVPDNNNRSDGS